MKRTTSATVVEHARPISSSQQLNASSTSSITDNPIILATASYDHTIRFWELFNGVCYRTVQHVDTANAIAISPDAKFVAVAGNPKVKIYEIEVNAQATNPPLPIAIFEGHTMCVTCVGFHKQMRWLFSASEDGTIKFWDLKDVRMPMEEKKKYPCIKTYNHRAPVNTAILHPTQLNMISGDQNGSIRVWDLMNDTCTHELIPDPEVPVRSLAVTHDGRFACAVNNKGDCYVWQIENPLIGFSEGLQPFQRLSAHSTYILKCTFSPDGQYLATASADHTIKLWRVPDFTLVRTLLGHQRWVWDCAFSSDSGFLVSVSSDHTARLWDIQTGECVRQFEEHLKGVVCLSLYDGHLTMPASSLPSLPPLAHPIMPHSISVSGALSRAPEQRRVSINQRTVASIRKNLMALR